jgi:hypothetical protein
LRAYEGQHLTPAAGKRALDARRDDLARLKAVE